jgi:hypothetical protein
LNAFPEELFMGSSGHSAVLGLSAVADDSGSPTPGRDESERIGRGEIRTYLLIFIRAIALFVAWAMLERPAESY